MNIPEERECPLCGKMAQLWQTIDTATMIGVHYTCNNPDCEMSIFTTIIRLDGKPGKIVGAE